MKSSCLPSFALLVWVLPEMLRGVTEGGPESPTRRIYPTTCPNTAASLHLRGSPRVRRGTGSRDCASSRRPIHCALHPLGPPGLDRQVRSLDRTKALATVRRSTAAGTLGSLYSVCSLTKLKQTCRGSPSGPAWATGPGSAAVRRGETMHHL